ILGAGIGVATVAARVDSELPRRLKALGAVDYSAKPGVASGQRYLRVAHVHGDVVSPRVHLTGDFGEIGGEIRNGRRSRAIFAKVDHGGVEDGLQIFEVLPGALCVRWQRDKGAQ